MKTVIKSCVIFLMILFVKSELDSETLASMKQQLLTKSNEYRKKHCADNLAMDDDLLSQVAQNYAEKLANEIKNLTHNKDRNSTDQYGKTCGENLYWTSSQNPTIDTATDAINNWYNEKDNYDFSTGAKKEGNTGDIGHFTQLVWKGSKKVGFGIATGTNGTFIVADYYPSGNYANNYITNVTDGSECTLDLTAFRKELLNQTNKYRKKHCVMDLTMDDDNLTKVAQDYADKLANEIKSVVPNENRNTQYNNPVGENIYFIAVGNPNTTTLTEGIDTWYNETNNYDFTTGLKKEGKGDSDYILNFTQLVWKGTQKVGFGIASTEEGTYIVANFYPSGNEENNYITNVIDNSECTLNTVDLTSLRKELLNKANEYRYKHCAANLTMDDNKLTKVAQDYAEKLAILINSLVSNENKVNEYGKSCGENLYYNAIENPTNETSTNAINEWYNEFNNYDFSKGRNKEGNTNPIGNFTQLVWNETKRVGFGIASTKKGTYIVAYFYPPGNTENNYVNNVGDNSVCIIKNNVNLTVLRNALLNKANEYRHNHCADNLTMDDSNLTQIAQEYSEKSALETKKLIPNTNLESDYGQRCGENLYLSPNQNPNENNIIWIIDNWYNEIENYNFTTGLKKEGKEDSDYFLNFTQLIWKGSKKVGFGITATNKGTYIVAYFYPSGNIKNKEENYFITNVTDSSACLNLTTLDLEAMREELLNKTNEYRKIHCVDELTMDDSNLTQIAQNYAEKLARDNKSLDSNEEREIQYGDVCGENLYKIQIINPNVTQVGEAIDKWYEEIANYNFTSGLKKNEEDTDIGNFTQLVWNETQSVGFGIASTDYGTYIVANFYPPGNIEDKYTTNVNDPSECIILKPLHVESFREELLNKTNEYRKKHCADDLIMDEELTEIAQNYSEILALEINALVPNEEIEIQYNDTCGENLFWSPIKDPRTVLASEVIDNWYEEKDNYDFSTGLNKEGNTGDINHFTQLVWKGSKKVGFGIASSNYGTFIVAYFYPQGNYENNYIGNITAESSCASLKSLDVEAMRQELLTKSNEYRKSHCSPDLEMDDEKLTEVAQAYAEKLATEIKDLVHNSNRQLEYGSVCGENLYYNAIKIPTTDTATNAINDWYNEIDNYNFNKGTRREGKSGAFIHFTQLIWKGSQKVGFGIASTDSGTYIVANYYPAGNSQGGYVENVVLGLECNETGGLNRTDKGNHLKIVFIGLVLCMMIIL